MFSLVRQLTTSGGSCRIGVKERARSGPRLGEPWSRPEPDDLESAAPNADRFGCDRGIGPKAWASG
jgi:hypothetical protein